MCAMSMACAACSIPLQSAELAVAAYNAKLERWWEVNDAMFELIENSLVLDGVRVDFARDLDFDRCEASRSQASKIVLRWSLGMD